MKSKWIFLIVAVAILAVGAWRIFGNISKFDVTPPKSETSALVPLQTSLSSITLPIYIPIHTLKDFLEATVQETIQGSKRSSGLFIKWSGKRSPVSIISTENKLQFSANIIGAGVARARNAVTGVIGSIVGTVLCANPSSKIANFNIKGPVSFSMVPQINPKWRLDTTSFSLVATLNDARLRVLCLPSFSLRSKLQPKLNSWTTKQTRKLKTRIAGDDFLEKAAKKHWKELCRSFPLDSSTGFWLEVKPVAVRAAQPMIDQENVRLQLGLDAQTRVVTEQTKPDCPFPPTLIIESPRDGRIEITLPTQIDYSTLQATLDKEVVGKTISREGFSLTIKAIKLRPHGNSLLLETELAARAGGWFGARVEGILYLLAKPELNAKEQTLRLVNVDLDTASKNKLVAILGEAIEPILLNAIKNRATFNLKPELDGKLRDMANTAIKRLSSTDLAINSQVEEIRLTRLDIGASHLRLIATARAKAEVAIQKIKHFGR